jgi:hypothetical protein
MRIDTIVLRPCSKWDITIFQHGESMAQAYRRAEKIRRDSRGHPDAPTGYKFSCGDEMLSIVTPEELPSLDYLFGDGP